MNTPTHMLINWTVAGPIARRIGKTRFPASAVLLGSVAPDLPLYGLVFGGVVWFGWYQQWPADQVAQHMFSTLFYEDPIWISLHNCLHSPTLLLILLGLVWWRVGRQQMADRWITWFLGSCLLHTLVDIPVHHDDGPLIFWPINWSYRYSSPLSYWDPKHYGIPVSIFEGLLALLLAVRLLIRRFWPPRVAPKEATQD